MKQYFSNLTSNGIVTNREFWKTMQLFFTDNSDMMLSGDNEMLTDDRRSTKIFNEHYINIVARTVQSVTMKILIRE